MTWLSWMRNNDVVQPCYDCICVRRSYRNPDTVPHCQTCGYSLFGLGQPRCPECGTPFNPDEITDEEELVDPRNEVDIRAIRNERIRGIAGLVFLAVGLIINIYCMREFPPKHGASFGGRGRDVRVGLYVAPFFLYLSYKDDDANFWRHSWLCGVVVLALGLLFLSLGSF